jgi:hypothetical protein
MAKTKSPKRKSSGSSKRKADSSKKSKIKPHSRKSTIVSRKKIPLATKRRPSGSRSAASKTKEKETNKFDDGHAVARVMGQGQYRIDALTVSKLNKIDNDIVKLVSEDASSSDNGGSDDVNSKFQHMLIEMISLITDKGIQVDLAEIIPSDFIVPPSDVSIDEAREMFRGEGLIPG